MYACLDVFIAVWGLELEPSLFTRECGELESAELGRGCMGLRLGFWRVGRVQFERRWSIEDGDLAGYGGVW